jgi:hypothetical protein
LPIFVGVMPFTTRAVIAHVEARGAGSLKPGDIFIINFIINAPYAGGTHLMDVKMVKPFNYTSLMHGHAHPAVTEVATRRLARGASFPLPTAEEIDLAAFIVERMAAIDQVRFTNSLRALTVLLASPWPARLRPIRRTRRRCSRSPPSSPSRGRRPPSASAASAASRWPPRTSASSPWPVRSTRWRW